MKKITFVLTLVLAISIFQSCQKEETIVDNGAAPALPPAESFIMPFTGFENADTSGFTSTGGGAEERTLTFHNWVYGVTHVLVWNTILTVNLAIPVASFREAFNHEAEFQGNGVWLWAYEFTGDAGATYKAKLYGELLVGDGVQWDMYISKVGGFSDVHWYSGTTSNNGSAANWTLNHQPNNPQSFLSIDYTKDNGNNVGVIRYTNIQPDNPGNGGYIEHRRSNDQSVEFNRAYDIFNAENNNLLEINWNAPDRNGRVKDEAKFGDQDWHCWDVNLQDIDC